MALGVGETRLSVSSAFRPKGVMNKHKVLITVVFVCLAVSVSNAANIIYVDVNSPNNPGAGTFGNPFRKIQAGINAAVPGDTVQISPGIYTGTGNYNLDPAGKAITIRSTNPEDAKVVANTVIDPNKAGRGFYIRTGEDANCIISGLTITNAHTGGKGGGVFCYNSSPTITNCVITGNSANTHGGGFFFQLSNAAVIGCVITGNSAVLDGGGLECWSGNPAIKNCIISHNIAISGNGGGVDCYLSGNAMVINCSLVKNYAGSGGALYCLGSNVTFTNSILWANDANQGSQIGLEPYAGITSNLSITYSNVQGGSALVYDPCERLVWGIGNIDSDPCFASFAPNGDPNLWDFHLQSAYGRWEPNEQNWVTDSNTSLCIDAGNPNSDWTGEPWPNGKRINMGAYGGTNQASKNGNIADFDVNGKVDFTDFALFAEQWNQESGTIEDINRDGVVDVLDLDIFTDNWLWEK
jgi:hypothetical protein